MQTTTALPQSNSTNPSMQATSAHPPITSKQSTTTTTTKAPTITSPIPCNCQNGGTCVPGPQNTVICSCLTGYSGVLCQTSTSVCEESPCSVNGQCYDNAGSAACKCIQGWGGSICNEDIDECLTSPCGLNEVCQNSVGSYVCICPPGFRSVAPTDCRELAVMNLTTSKMFGNNFWQSDVIYLNNAFTLGGESQNSFRICSSGYITPGSQGCWSNYFWGNLKNAYFPFIAGYMGSFLINANASAVIKYDIFYKSKSSDNPTFRQKVDSIILQANQGLNYSSEMIIYVHWNNVQKYDWYFYYCTIYRFRQNAYNYNYDCSNVKSETANFELIISSDGTNTYTIFNHDKPTWNTDSFSYYQYLSGYTDTRGSYGMVPGSLNQTSQDFSRFEGNTGVYGRWVYKVGSYASPQVKCQQWISENNNGNLSCTMCPPTFDQALSSRGVLHRVSSCSQQETNGSANNFQITFQLRTRFSTLFSPSTYSAGVCSYTVTFKNQLADRMRPYLCSNVSSTYRKMSYLKIYINKIQSYFRNKNFNQISGGALNENYPSTGSLFVIYYNLKPNRWGWWSSDYKYNSWSSESYGYDICIHEAKMYSAYAVVRPPCGTSDTYWLIRTQIALMNGDPHITTPDGRSWTFNGLGEYILARTKLNLNASEAVPMLIQARTSQAISKVTNTTSKATIFSGFSAMANNTATVQILYNAITDDIDVYINGTLETNCTSLLALETALTFGGGSVVASSNTSIIVSFDADFSMTISKTMNFLQITLALGTTYKTVIEGLLGNFNGDSTDEFIMPNGNLVADNSTERQLFVYGQTWRVTNASDSLFTYTQGAPFESFYDANFEPVYAEDFADPIKLLGLFDNDTQLLSNANVTCQHPVQSIFLACMYDVSQLKDPNAGSTVVSSNEEFSESKAVLENTPPKFNMPKLIYLNINSQTHINLTIVDDEGHNFTVQASENLGGNSSVTTMNISITQNVLTVAITSTTSTGFTVEAFDSLNAVGMWQPKIRLCACQNNGVCSFEYLENDLSPESSNNVYLAQCGCMQYYSGQQCEITPCMTDPSPCYNSTSCQMGGESVFTCAPCPSGMVGDGKTCDDRNECQENSTICEDVCVNTQGGYECQCNMPGFNVSSSDPSKCADIDECADKTANCTGMKTCNNTIGSYQCLCPTGYTKDLFGDCQDTNECTTGVAQCPATSECVNTPGSYSCICKSGFTGSNPNCTDVDECLDPNACPSNSTCQNSIGSFACDCNSGYVKQGSLCVVKPKCSSSNCINGVCATDGNSCLCKKKFGGEMCNKNVLQYSVRGKMFRYINGKGTEEEYGGIYEKTSDPEYIRRGSKICEYLSTSMQMSGTIFGTANAFVGCKFSHFSEGSVIYNADLQFNADVGYAIEDSLIQSAINKGSLKYLENPSNVEYGADNSASAIAVFDDNECTSNTHDCTGEAKCVNTNGGYTCVTPTSNANTIQMNGCFFKLITLSIGILILC